MLSQVASWKGPVAVFVSTSLPSTVILHVTVPPCSPVVTMTWHTGGKPADPYGSAP